MTSSDLPQNLYFHRDGTPVKTRREMYAMLGDGWEWDPANPDCRQVTVTKGLGVTVSTVFLGINHAYNDGPPLIFETMVFGGKYSDYTYRYASEAEALEGHKQIIRQVFGWRRFLPKHDLIRYDDE